MGAASSYRQSHVLFLLILFFIPTCTPSLLSANEALTAEKLQHVFESTSPQAWTLSTVPEAAWDLRVLKALSVNAVVSGGAGFVRLRWRVVSRVGGVYQTLAASDISPGAPPLTVELVFDPSETNLIPAGHQRPWDALAASSVFSLELHAESAAQPWPSVVLSHVNFQRSALNPAEPRLTNLTLSASPAEYRAKYCLSFRIDPLPLDPYSADGDGDVRIRMSDGRSYLAFLDQRLMDISEGSASQVQPVTLPLWRAYIPESALHGNLEVVSGTHHWPLGSTQLAALKTQPSPQINDVDKAGNAAPGRWHPPLQVDSGSHLREFGGPVVAWSLKRDAIGETTKSGNRWVPLEHSAAAQTLKESPLLWRPVPFWNAGWGGFGGTQFPDLTIARQMDLQLNQAAANGERRPLTIIDGEGFVREGSFNWESHPLQRLLRDPIDLYDSDLGMKFCRRWMRYCLARWGRSTAVSAFWITASAPNRHSAEFYRKIADSLLDWNMDSEMGLPVIAWNPLAGSPKTELQLGSFKDPPADSPNQWTADTRMAPSTGTRTLSADGNRVFEVRARESSSTQIGLSGTFMLGAPRELACADALLFEVWVPPESPPNLRLGVHLCDRDGHWYQTLLPGIATSGRWSTYLLDVSPNNADGLTPSGNTIEWSASNRDGLTELGLTLYAAQKNVKDAHDSKVAKDSGVLTARFAEVRAISFKNSINSPAPLPPVYQRITLLSSFEPNGGNRYPVEWKQTVDGIQYFSSKESATDGKTSLEVRATETPRREISVTGTLTNQRFEFRRPAPDDFSTAEVMLFDVCLPASAPSDIRVGVHLRDCDDLWYQCLLPVLAKPGEWVTYGVDLTGANFNQLTGIGHQKAWTEYSRRRVREIGVHLFSTHDGWPRNGTLMPMRARLDNFRLMREIRKPSGEAPSITTLNLEPASQELYSGELWQRHFQISKTFKNPFDPCECDLTAIITTPSGKVVHVPAFFDQACVRREATPGGDEIVEGVGGEFFTVRYRAVESGPHKATLELREGGKYNVQSDGRNEKVSFMPGPITANLQLPDFTVINGARKNNAAKPFHGFIRVAKDKRHFEYDDGSFYYPMGPCLRSPSDNRVAYYGWDVEKSEPLSRRGTYQYDAYFEQFEKAGMTWARVWMSPWWGALEWRRDWPGFQGAGQYSLVNAWRIDHLLEDAEKRGIAVTLCLTNHGQYSTRVDAEWDDNPFSSELGGPLDSPNEFFSTAKAKILHENKLRYVAARYGHSPAVMEWSLFSELEWTQGDDESKNNWHAEMAAFLKSIDPNRHLVSTHFSHPKRGESTLSVPEIDVAASNAYSVFRELGNGSCDASAALADFWAGNEYLNGFHIYNKPALVEEQGRHFMGNNTKDQLDADLHAGLWGGMTQPLAGATGYWWWLHLHLDNRYSEYRALANFMAGEDMRSAEGEAMLEPVFRPIRTEGADEVLLGRALKSDRRIYLWIYHRETPLGDRVPDIAGGVLKVGGLKPGPYRAEFWNTYTGTLMESRDCEIKIENGKPKSIELELPVVKRDLAVKIKPR